MSRNTLVWRFFTKNWRVQLAITLLFGVSITLLIIYGAYLERESALLRLRMSDQFPEGRILVSVKEPQNGPSPLRAHHAAGPVPASYLGSWRYETTPSSIGKLPVAVLVDTEGLGHVPQAGQVSIPGVVAREHGLKTGDSLTLKRGNSVVGYTVAGTHDGAMFGQRLVIADSAAAVADNFLYQSNAPLAATVSYLQRSYPEARFVHSQTSVSEAKGIIGAIYSPGRRATNEAIMFVTLAFLTVTLFGFLEKRKVLAVVKALGLRSSELVALIASEGFLPPLFGSLLGCALGYGLLQWLIGAGQEFPVTAPIFIRSVLSIWPAVLIGILIPSRYVQVATVNQLLFERAVPMQTVQITEIHKRYPGLDPFIARGIQFIKLVMDKGHFDGFIFRQYGDHVKKGEIIAMGVNWWGLQVVEYTSPLTGQIVVFQEEIGLFGVAPEGAYVNEGVPSP